MAAPRKIIHIDMDAFFAAVEQRDFPDYRNKPIIVGGSPFSRGVVATCSYEARPYGIHSAMPSSQAYRLCPEAIFVTPRFEAYREVSALIRKIFFEFTNQVEPLSLDEAYLDVSECRLHNGSASLIAKDIKKRIKAQTQLTASAGVSYNKFLAKIASDINKPDGFYLITPEQGEAFIEQLPIRKFHGVGAATARKMEELGINTGKELKQISLPALQRHFGKAGSYYYQIARGIDHRLVVNSRASKSIGTETTFQEDICNPEVIVKHLELLFEKALTRVKEKKLSAQTMTLKIKYHDFVQITRSKTVRNEISLNNGGKDLMLDLLKDTEIGKRPLRLLGVTLSSLSKRSHVPAMEQTDLFS